jgi:hypothetical protein
VTIPNNVTSIGQQAFANCNSLTNVTIPNGVTSIGFWAFIGCENLVTVTLSDTVTSIADGAFAACTNLQSLTVSAQNPTFSSRAGVLFNKAQTTLIQYPAGKADSSYTIPDNVASITPYAFNRCGHLTMITVSEKNSTYRSVGGVLFNHNLTLLVAYPPGAGGIYTIPDRVTGIEQCAFSGRNLSTVTMPNTVTNLGAGAFSYCNNLTSVTISDSVTSIGPSAFNGCNNLTNVTIPNSVADLGDFAFACCDNLTAIYFKGNVPRFGNNMFEGSNKVKVYYLPGTTGWGKEFGGRPTAVWEMEEGPFGYTTQKGAANITKYTGPGGDVAIPGRLGGVPVAEIADQAFKGCSNLTSVTIPNSVIHIRDGAFMECGTLLSFEVDSANPHYSSAGGVLFSKDKTRLIRYPAGKAGDYTIPGTVSGIGDGAFAGCSNVTGVTIPDNVTSIGGYSAFRDCPALTGVSLPRGITCIGNCMFSGCGSLTKVTIPAGVTNIDAWAFRYCSSLTRVHCQGDAPTLGGDVFLKATNVTIHYRPGTKGWGEEFGGRPTAVWDGKMQIIDEGKKAD